MSDLRLDLRLKDRRHTMTIENVSWIDFESGSQRVYPRSCGWVRNMAGIQTRVKNDESN
jgi:hypothetical protein